MKTQIGQASTTTTERYLGGPRAEDFGGHSLCWGGTLAYGEGSGYKRATDELQQQRYYRFWEKLKAPGEYSDEDLAVLRADMESITEFNSATKAYAETRMALELLFAIRKFDKASGEMVTRGNRINAWVLVFAILAFILGGAAVWISWLSYRLALIQGG